MTIVIAMDGPSGSGKSSTSKSIAKRAGWLYLDTGALYRAATWLAIKETIDDAPSLVAALQKSPIVFKTDPDNPITLCGGVDISQAIRTPEVTSAVSRISAWPEVRQSLLTLQRKIIESAKNGIVVEGRDIGTVVAPQAQLKIWLQADINARAIRRDIEQREANIASGGISEVADALASRDQLDSTRSTSPLKKADDAIVVDSTNLSLNETVDYIWNILKQRSLIGLPRVVIIGRPNVGKSTLVNRIIGSREAIIEDTPGVTRDRVSYEAEWNGKSFVVVDTGGWEPTAEGIALKISDAAESAIVDADLVLFVVDAQVGQQSDDDALISVLRKSKKPIMLIANKVDSDKDELEAHSLWNLGLGEPHFISAAHGRGSGDLLDLIVAQLPEVGQSRMDDGYRRIAIVGRPNVGKSSLLNSFAGTTRALVDDAEGTTRDPIDELIDLGDKTWRFIDTAGIRRRAHQASGSDYYAALRTERAIENAEVVIMVLDASVPITEQDLRIISLVEDSGKALVIGMNKWDLMDDERRISLEKETDRNFDQVEWAERVNISAKTGWHKDRLLPAIERALSSWEQRVPTGRLNSFLGQLIEVIHHPFAVVSNQKFSLLPKLESPLQPL